MKLDQNWTEAAAAVSSHAQGTRLIPADWFKALEQPCFSPFGCGKFADTAYLGRFGFIPSPADATESGWVAGRLRRRQTSSIRSTSAPSRRGAQLRRVPYRGAALREAAVTIEGGPGMIEVAAFQKALGLALGFTKTFPMRVGRYGRFEERVLGPNATDQRKAALKSQLRRVPRSRAAEARSRGAADLRQSGRLHADRCARRASGTRSLPSTSKRRQLCLATAPVRYPQIWDASWFNWVQYNSSIADPLARNIGEALGVRAVAKLYGPDAGEIRKLRQRRRPASDRKSAVRSGSVQGPRVAEMAIRVSAVGCRKVAAGAELYKQHCQGCHLPPLRDLSPD